MARSRRILPGFGLSLGYSMTYLSLIILIPLAACVSKASTVSFADWQEILGSERVQAAMKVSFGTSIVAAMINAVLGLLVAWVLVRYSFWGKRLLDALVDFPFALPTAVAGLTFADLFAANDLRTGWLARFWNPMITGLLNAWNATLAPVGKVIGAHWHLGPDWHDFFSGYASPTAIVIVLVFTGFPFVVRTLQPVLEEMDPELEEAAACLGANRWYTFRRVIFPTLMPAWLTGMALAFARGVGEYGSVIFVSGNIRFHTEIVPVIIYDELGEFRYAHATALAVILLVISFTVLLGINLLSNWTRRFV
jgi:sulfate/thiosulfate transport system permease protein